MLLRHCPDQVYYTALRAIAQQYSPYENMVSFESVFKFYDNYNVKFSNVLIESTAYDALLYGFANNYVQFHGVKLQGVNFDKMVDYHVPINDPELGLRRFI